MHTLVVFLDASLRF